jgi:hypothetical protein
LTVGTADDVVICVPPDAAVNHPVNEYPVLVGVGSVPNAVPTVLVALVGDTLPPLAFHVIVTVAACQTAYSVMPAFAV